jgi:hypothetical protein
MVLIKIDEKPEIKDGIIIKEFSYSKYRTKIKAILNKNKKFIILFHSSRCGACISLHEYWGKTIKEFEKKIGIKIPIFEIEESSFKHIIKDNIQPLSEMAKQVKYIPMLFYIEYDKKNKIIHYHEEKVNNAKDLNTFLNNAKEY